MATDAKQSTRINPAIHAACKIAAKQDNTTLYQLVERSLIKNLIMPNDPDLAAKLSADIEAAREIAKTGKYDKSQRKKLPQRASTEELQDNSGVVQAIDSRTKDELPRKQVLEVIDENQKIIAVNGGVMAGVLEAAKTVDRYVFEVIEDTLIMNVISPLNPNLAIDIRDTIAEARTRKLMRKNSKDGPRQESPIVEYCSAPCEDDYPITTSRLLVVSESDSNHFAISDQGKVQLQRVL